jgi:hypothetical protein
MSWHTRSFLDLSLDMDCLNNLFTLNLSATEFESVFGRRANPCYNAAYEEPKVRSLPPFKPLGAWADFTLFSWMWGLIWSRSGTALSDGHHLQLGQDVRCPPFLSLGCPARWSWRSSRLCITLAYLSIDPFGTALVAQARAYVLFTPDEWRDLTLAADKSTLEPLSVLTTCVNVHAEQTDRLRRLPTREEYAERLKDFYVTSGRTTGLNSLAGRLFDTGHPLLAILVHRVRVRIKSNVAAYSAWVFGSLIHRFWLPLRSPLVCTSSRVFAKYTKLEVYVDIEVPKWAQ